VENKICHRCAYKILCGCQSFYYSGNQDSTHISSIRRNDDLHTSVVAIVSTVHKVKQRPSFLEQNMNRLYCVSNNPYNYECQLRKGT